MVSTGPGGARVLRLDEKLTYIANQRDGLAGPSKSPG